MLIVMFRNDTGCEAGRQIWILTTNNGAHMFEYDQSTVQSLLSKNKNFQRLFQRHNMLKEKVKSAEIGTIRLDDMALGTIKKEKLMAKDQMAAIIADFNRTQ